MEIPASNLPPQLRDRLCRTAAFANPVFFERERARLSTHKTPRVIACHELTGDHLLLPRGCLDPLIDELKANGVKADVDDLRSDGTAITASFNGTLSEDQGAA